MYHIQRLQPLLLMLLLHKQNAAAASASVAASASIAGAYLLAAKKQQWTTIVGLSHDLRYAVVLGQCKPTPVAVEAEAAPWESECAPPTPCANAADAD
jgi:hypothetical protein